LGGCNRNTQKRHDDGDGGRIQTMNHSESSKSDMPGCG
jgi:hypothetical protein